LLSEKKNAPTFPVVVVVVRRRDREDGPPAASVAAAPSSPTRPRFFREPMGFFFFSSFPFSPRQIRLWFPCRGNHRNG
jgi:hypothetical protein